MKINLFADGADKTGILEMYQNPRIDGFTTNPTLMCKAGVNEWDSYGIEKITWHKMLPEMVPEETTSW